MRNNMHVRAYVHACCQSIDGMAIHIVSCIAQLIVITTHGTKCVIYTACALVSSCVHTAAVQKCAECVQNDLFCIRLLHYGNGTAHMQYSA